MLQGGIFILGQPSKDNPVAFIVRVTLVGALVRVTSKPKPIT